MKNFIFTLLFLVVGMSQMFAQNSSIEDVVSVDKLCQQTALNLVSTSSYNFPLTFETSGIIFSTQEKFRRDVNVIFTNSFGAVFGPFPVSDRMLGNGTDVIDVTNEHFATLPDGDYVMSVVVGYYCTGFGLSTQVEVEMIDADTGSNCGQVFTSCPQRFECVIDDVICFNYNDCDDFYISFFEKHGKLNASVHPKGGSFSFTWYIFPDGGVRTPAGNRNSVNLINQCALYSLTITDLESGCTYYKERYHCPPLQELPPKGPGLQGDKDTKAIVRGKVATETSVTVYPNPTSYELNIDAENLVSDDVTISIVSLQGQSVFNTTTSTEEGSMKYTWTPQANIPAGVYFVNVIDQGKVINKRFVIIK